MKSEHSSRRSRPKRSHSPVYLLRPILLISNVRCHAVKHIGPRLNHLGRDLRLGNCFFVVHVEPRPFYVLRESELEVALELKSHASAATSLPHCRQPGRSWRAKSSIFGSFGYMRSIIS